MNKKAIVLVNEGLITDVLELRSFTNEDEYLKLLREACHNKTEFLKKKENKATDQRLIVETKLEIDEIDILMLKDEIKLLKGELPESAYNNDIELLSERKEKLFTKLEHLIQEKKQYELE